MIKCIPFALQKQGKIKHAVFTIKETKMQWEREGWFLVIF